MYTIVYRVYPFESLPIWPFKSPHITKVSLAPIFQCQTQSLFGDTVYPCYCKLRLVTPYVGGLRGRKLLILITLHRWKRHFREKNYIENYFYLLKSTKSTKITSQKCWRNIIWVDFVGRPYRTNGINTRLGLPVFSDGVLQLIIEGIFNYVDQAYLGCITW